VSHRLFSTYHIGAMRRSPSPRDDRGDKTYSGPGCNRYARRRGNGIGQTVRFEEILRRLAIIDESFVEDQAGLGLGMPGSGLLDPKTAALVQGGAGGDWVSGVCLECSPAATSATSAAAVGTTSEVFSRWARSVPPPRCKRFTSRSFDLDHRGMTDQPRWLIWPTVLAGGSVLAGWAGPWLRHVGGRY